LGYGFEDDDLIPSYPDRASKNRYNTRDYLHLVDILSRRLAIDSDITVKNQKDKKAKEAKEKKEKFDKLMKKASDLETEQKFSEALINVKQARTFATPQAIKSVDEKISALRMKIGQGSLFAAEQQVQPETQQQPEPVQPIPQSPPVSSIPQNEMQQIPIPQQIQQSTYQQPVNGNTNNGQSYIPQPVQQPQNNGGSNHSSNGIGFVPLVNNSPQMFVQANDQAPVSIRTKNVLSLCPLTITTYR